MIGCYDFCGHYEWTFGWMERVGDHELVRDYWNEAINHDSQRHARELIEREGIPGMLKYWGHTLAEESPSLGFTISHREDVFRHAEARLAASKAACLAAWILRRPVGMTIEHLRYQPDRAGELRDLQIQGPWTALTRLKGGNPEAFHHWYQAQRMLND